MIARLRPIAVVAALSVLCGAPALAQEDSVLQRYDLAVENLEFAIASVPGDAVQARDELERAVNALLTLSRDTTSATLLTAMQRTFERARTAVDNQSRADLAVQAAVLRGGFRRLVADSAFTAGAASDRDTALARLTHIAQDMGFAAADLEALQAAGPSLGDLRLAFEAGAAQAIAAELTVAERLLPSDREAAYESLGTAYGDSLLIQDSPRADPDLNAALLRAAQALVQNDDEAFETATGDAAVHLSRLASAARAGEPGVPRPAAEDQPAADQPSAGQPAQAEQPAADQAAQAAAQPADAAPAGDAPAASSEDRQAAPPATAAAPAEPVGELPAFGEAAPAAEEATPVVDVNLVRAQLEQERREAELAALSGELTRAGLPAGLARTQAGALLDAGFTTLGGAFDALAARVNQAVAAQRVGDSARAVDAIVAARAAFEPLRGMVGARDADVAARTAALFDSLLERPALREHDLTLLAATAEEARAALGLTAGGDAGLGVERAVDAVWGGWARLAVLFVLGLLAFLPLRYLNMAFGGGNANWRLVAWALFLLLLPVFYEALASLGSAVATLADMPALDVLARWSMFTSTTGHVVWAALVLLAVLFATIGLRGICAQFGLLGGGAAAPVGNTPTLVESTGVRHQTAVDWDDEF